MHESKSTAYQIYRMVKVVLQTKFTAVKADFGKKKDLR